MELAQSGLRNDGAMLETMRDTTRRFAHDARGVGAVNVTRRHRRAMTVLGVIAAAGLGACTGAGGSATAPTAGRPTHTAGAATAPTRPSSSAPTSAPASRSSTERWRVVVTRTRWRLPYPVSRAVATDSAGTIVLAGGLDRRGTSLRRVVWISPTDGRMMRSGRLPLATHDAAGWATQGGLVVAGGGVTSSFATVEQVEPRGLAARVVGSLPRPRSDAVAVVIRRIGYIVGGYTGGVLDPMVLASSDGGASFRNVARLPVPVRYPAVATTGAMLWVMGGQAAGGLTDVVQRLDTATGAARIVGRLPVPLAAATAHVVGARLMVFGGATRRGTTSTIVTCVLPTVRCAASGRLPSAVQNAAVATVGGHTYLLGGERDGRALDEVATIERIRTGSA